MKRMNFTIWHPSLFVAKFVWCSEILKLKLKITIFSILWGGEWTAKGLILINFRLTKWRMCGEWWYWFHFLLTKWHWSLILNSSKTAYRMAYSFIRYHSYNTFPQCSPITISFKDVSNHPRTNLKKSKSLNVDYRKC